MNIAYLDALPGLRTDIDDELGGDEKVVFIARLSCFGTETDQFLGGHSSRLYLTNRRIIADNTVGLWSVDLVEDVADCEIVERGIPFLNPPWSASALTGQSPMATGMRRCRDSASTSKARTASASRPSRT